MMKFLMVFLGGGIGSMCRYAFAILLHPWAKTYPLGTLAANLVSCVLLGIFLGASEKQWMDTYWKLLLMTGFCGGFSTFSTFSAEQFTMLQEGHLQTMLIYLVISIIMGLFCITLGYKTSTYLF